MPDTESDIEYEKLLMGLLRIPFLTRTPLGKIIGNELQKSITSRKIREDFGKALEEIWKANEGFTEAEVMADVNAAIAEVRAERRARMAEQASRDK